MNPGPAGRRVDALDEMTSSREAARSWMLKQVQHDGKPPLAGTLRRRGALGSARGAALQLLHLLHLLKLLHALHLLVAGTRARLDLMDVDLEDEIVVLGERRPRRDRPGHMVSGRQGEDVGAARAHVQQAFAEARIDALRSEERRVGKEGRSRGSA